MQIKHNNRDAIGQVDNPIQIKNKFINFLFQNKQLSQVTYCNTIVCFLITSIIFLGFGIFFFIEVSKVKQVTVQYYQGKGQTNCKLGSNCTISFNIPSQMTQPVYIMYQLGKNIIIKEISSKQKQLSTCRQFYKNKGYSIDNQQASSCYPYITNQDMIKTVSWGNITLLPSDIASPCGAIAFSYFNDTFSLFQNSTNSSIQINQKGISWPSDQAQKFKRSPNSTMIQWIDPENQHFIVWMRTSGLPNFKKPWGKIQKNLSPGNYQLQISNNYNSSQWQGSRKIILTTMCLIGGKNYLIPVAFILVGFLSLIGTIFFYRRFRMLKNIGELKN